MNGAAGRSGRGDELKQEAAGPGAGPAPRPPPQLPLVPAQLPAAATGGAESPAAASQLQLQPAAHADIAALLASSAWTASVAKAGREAQHADWDVPQ